MKLALLILKNLIKNTVLIFVIYLIIVNVTINVESLIDGLIKSICLGCLLVPMNLLNNFSPIIGKKAQYTRTIEFNKHFEESFKSTRTLLKTMCDLKLTDSNKETGDISLESDYSRVTVKLKALDDKKVSFTVSSISKGYDKLSNFDNYVKDAKNIISTLKLNFDPDNYDAGAINGSGNSSNSIQEFKPTIILYYRLFKLWSTLFLTLILFLGVYYYAINLLPSLSTIMFFIILFLYLLYIFTGEIEATCKLLTCPGCNEELIKKKYNLKEYKVSAKCNKCNTSLLETSDSEKVNDK